MKNDKFHIYLSDAERTQVIQTLIELKNSLLEQGKYTDAVDDVLLKFTKGNGTHDQTIGHFFGQKDDKDRSERSRKNCKALGKDC